GQYSFNNIIETTYKNCSTTLGPFFPPTPISSTYKPNQAPYTIDLDIEHTTMAGTRVLIVKDIVVQWVESDSNPNGKLTLIGGKIEDPLDELTDETLLYLFNNGIPPIPIPGPNPPDVPMDCVINEFKPNYDVLSAMGLTTFDCNPDIINDKLAFYTSLDGPDINDVVLPDIEKAMSDYTDAITELRSKINEDSIDKFRDRMNEIMGDLKDQTEDAYSNVLQTMTNPLYCTATLTPEIQFISGKIRVVVSLKSASKQTFKDVIGEATVPEKAKTDIIAKLRGNTTLGSLGDFQYDSATGTFFADISSGVEGDGVLTLYYDNQQFGQLIVPENIDENSRIEALEFPYTFIGGNIESDGATRRDESDVVNN
ncbi:MAG: hypothetical protein PHP35_03010, partial [Candidatus Colwellbacteria bacterium]|nr:hypothetical protein [Candidatus Colwellbacteria bacterium]